MPFTKEIEAGLLTMVPPKFDCYCGRSPKSIYNPLDMCSICQVEAHKVEWREPGQDLADVIRLGFLKISEGGWVRQGVS